MHLKVGGMREKNAKTKRRERDEDPDARIE